MILELYAYAERPQLIDEIEQIVVSCLDNTSGCVELSPDHKKLYFLRTTDNNGNVIPLDKLMIL